MVRHGSDGVVRLLVTTAEPGASPHDGFLANLRAYAADLGADLVVLPFPGLGRVDQRELAVPIERAPIDLPGSVQISARRDLPPRAALPLSSARPGEGAVWTIFAHPVVQLETLPRVRADGLRVALTTGACTMPLPDADGRRDREVGAVIVEIGADGVGHCRHLLSPADGDGSFQDLATRVAAGRVVRGCRVEMINFGDIHHAHINEKVAEATWGTAGTAGGTTSLVDRLRPRRQVFHDVCDFDARSPWDRSDHLRRFAQHASGGGSVEAELRAAAAFLARTRRDWCGSIVVGSNHDDRLVGWLREADFREDPANALFFLETSLAMHRRLARGAGSDGFFEATLRRLSPDGLRGVRFLTKGEGLKVVGIEIGVHGDLGPDGGKGGLRAVERLGIRVTIGHTHRPTTREGVVGAGVCQTGLAYARGPLTAWAVGHVVTYFNGARQHLLFEGGRFHA